MAEKKEVVDFKVGDVVTQTGKAVIDENGEALSELEALVLLLNDVRELKRKLVG